MARLLTSTCVGVSVLALFVLAPGSATRGGIVQWDFNGDLSPSTDGSELVAEFAAPATEPMVEFVTETIGGDEAEVASFSQGTMFRMTHGLSPNGGGLYVNQYTLIMDVMFPDTTTSGWTSLWQTNTTNSNDGDWFIRGSDKGLGISGNYAGFVEDGVWHRLALVVDCVAGTFTCFVDGVQAIQQIETDLGVDLRWSLDTFAFLFADEGSENSAGFVNSVQIRDSALTASEVAALGGPDAEGISLPTNPRDCQFRGFAVSYDPAANTVTGTWVLLPGDEGFRAFEGARQIGGDLPSTATSFTDTAPPVGGTAATYKLQCLAGGKVETECLSREIQTFTCHGDLACVSDSAQKKATLTWKGAVNSGATGYEILRNGQSLTTLAADAQSYIDETLPGPGMYAYRLLVQSMTTPACPEVLECSVAVLGDGILFFDSFDSYATDDDLVAAGWEIQEVNTPSELCVWTLTNPGARGNPPTSSGQPSSGKFLVSDSDAADGDDHQGSGMSHDILSPAFDATGKTVVWLHMDCSAMLNNNGEVIFDIDVNSADSDSWENVFRRVAPGRSVEPLPTADIPDGFAGGPQVGNADAVYGPIDLDISEWAAGKSSVRFRLRQFEPSDDWWIAVDNVRVDGTPVAGGSRTVLEEDFGGGIPDEWEIESLIDSTAQWSDTDACLASLLLFNGGVFPDGLEGRRLHHFDDVFAMAGMDESTCTAVPQDEWLRTPVLDLTGTTKAYLHVKSDILITNAVAEILLSTDGSQTFDAANPVFTYNAPGAGLVRNPGNAEVVYNEYIFEVPAAAGKSQVSFAFHYTNSPTGDPPPDAGFWAIDDVKVTVEGGDQRPQFYRADPNNDGTCNITDGIYILNFLFLGGPQPTCRESADANNDKTINITDGIFVLNYLFLGGPSPASPGPPGKGAPCGPDTDAAGTPGDLGCDVYTKC